MDSITTEIIYNFSFSLYILLTFCIFYLYDKRVKALKGKIQANSSVLQAIISMYKAERDKNYRLINEVKDNDLQTDKKSK